MRSLGGVFVVSVALCFSQAIAQSSRAREYVSREYKIAISLPASWVLKPPVRNEVWLATGEVRGNSAGCFVRVSAIPNLDLVKPDDYFGQVDEKAFVKLNSIATPDIRVHLFDFATLGGRKARRIIYSGTDEGVRVGNLVYQSLYGNRIVTVTCFTEQQQFQSVYKELAAVAASFRFLK